MDLLLNPQNRGLYEAVESKPFHRASESKLERDTTTTPFTVFFFQESAPDFSPKELLLGTAHPAPTFAC